MERPDSLPLDLIEWHDSSVEKIDLSVKGDVKIHFDKLTAYFQEAAERYQLWICRAVRALEGVSKLELEGMLPPKDWISDSRLELGGKTVELATLLAASAPVDSLSIEFTNAAVFMAALTGARLIEFSPQSFLEMWTGPLSGSDR